MAKKSTAGDGARNIIWVGVPEVLRRSADGSPARDSEGASVVVSEAQTEPPAQVYSPQFPGGALELPAPDAQRAGFWLDDPAFRLVLESVPGYKRFAEDKGRV